MKNNFFRFVIIFLLIAISGCTHKNKSDVNAPSTNTIDEKVYQQKELPTTTNKAGDKSPGSVKDINNPNEQNSNIKDVTNRMIIKTGTMNLEVDKYDETEKRATDIAKKYNGFISGSNSNLNSGGKKQGTIMIKVPADKYDALIAEITTLGKVMNQNINANDITEEYIDLEARIKTQKELEQRLLKLLSEKTARLTDVVEVEQKLASVRQVIESIDGRMRYLKSQSEMSTLILSIFEPSLLVTSSGGGFFYEISQGFKKGLEAFTEVLSGLITVVIAIIPLIIFLVILIYLVIYIIAKLARIRKRVVKKAESSSSS
jgi:methyl coenzyme M reductase subunit D